MTAPHHDLVIRPVTGPGELDLFCQLPYLLNEELAADLDDGHRRPEWLWMALDGDRLLARAAWWTRPGIEAPQRLDIFDLADHGIADHGGGPERLDIGEQLLRAATSAMVPDGGSIPEYGRFIPAGWRDDPVARQVVTDRMNVLDRTGARLFIERIRLEWQPGTPVAARPGRLSFGPVTDPQALIALMAAVTEGSLDGHTRRDLARMSPAEAAGQQYDQELALYQSPREWWRMATAPGGEPAGFVIPADNEYNPIIAYIGVLPACRGRGYIDELLAEGTRILAAAGVPRIRATTDVGNVPMARAFRRAGWADFGHEINMTWD